MRTVDLTRPAGAQDPARTARLTRHLKARLEDFGPGGPEVVSADQQAGQVLVRFPGHDAAQVLRRLEDGCGVRAVPRGGAGPVSPVPPGPLRGRKSLINVYCNLCGMVWYLGICFDVLRGQVNFSDKIIMHINLLHPAPV